MNRRELVDFGLHLRPHYQLFILSGGYLAGGVFVPRLDVPMFVAHFFLVHLLLFGGATAYNSYYDEDEGPIGGLRNPPKMTRWMLPVSLAIQWVGLAAGALLVGVELAVVWAVSMLFFWLYSTPHARWKGSPGRSLVAIAVSTGTGSVLLGYLAGGGGGPTGAVVLAALGVASILLSMYPVSQIFQVEEDEARGDRTFAVAFGLGGIQRFFVAAYWLGVALLGPAFAIVSPTLGGIFVMVSLGSFVVVFTQLRKLRGVESEYDSVMRLKYVTSFSFVAFLTSVLVVLRVAPHLL